MTKQIIRPGLDLQALKGIQAAVRGFGITTEQLVFNMRRFGSTARYIRARQLRAQGCPLNVALGLMLRTSERFTHLHRD